MKRRGIEWLLASSLPSWKFPPPASCESPTLPRVKDGECLRNLPNKSIMKVWRRRRHTPPCSSSCRRDHQLVAMGSTSKQEGREQTVTELSLVCGAVASGTKRFVSRVMGQNEQARFTWFDKPTKPTHLTQFFPKSLPRQLV